MEFVTQPLSDEGAVNTVFGSMSSVMKSLLLNPVVEAGTSDEQSGVVWESVVGYERYRFTPKVGKRAASYENALFAPQATLDIPFDRVEQFLHVQGASDESRRLVGSHFQESADYLRSTPPEQFMPKGTITDLGPIGLQPSTRGFLRFVLMALCDAYLFKPAKPEDPKYAFPVMPRNRYSEMFTAADKASGAQLAAVWPSFVTGINKFRKRQGIEQMFTGVYQTDDNSDPGFTVAAWLSSITNPGYMEGEFAAGGPKARSADLLSPPPGQRSKKEGLGAYDLAGGTIPFFELRDFMSAHSAGKHYTLPDIHSAALSLLALETAMKTHEND